MRQVARETETYCIKTACIQAARLWENFIEVVAEKDGGDSGIQPHIGEHRQEDSRQSAGKLLRGAE